MYEVLGAQNPATTVKVVDALNGLFAGFNAPTTWALMIAGLAILGLALRDRRSLGLGEI